jgi:hypothetical protein
VSGELGAIEEGDVELLECGSLDHEAGRMDEGRLVGELHTLGIGRPGVALESPRADAGDARARVQLVPKPGEPVVGERKGIAIERHDERRTGGVECLLERGSVAHVHLVAQKQNVSAGGQEFEPVLRAVIRGIVDDDELGFGREMSQSAEGRYSHQVETVVHSHQHAALHGRPRA